MAQTRVNIPGKGVVRFPEGMTPEDIRKAILKIEGGTGPATPAQVAAKPEPESRDTGSFFPSPGEFVRRMGRQLISPVEPIKKLGQRAATAIEGVDRAPVERAPLVQMLSDAVSSMRESPMTGIAELTGIPGLFRGVRDAAPAFAEQPLAAARGFGAGVVEEISSLSPIEALLLRVGGRKLKGGKGSAGTTPSGRGPTPPADIPPPVPAAELADVAKQVSTALRENLAAPRDLGPSLVRRAEGAKASAPRTTSPGMRPRLSTIKAPTVEEAITAALEEIRKPESPTRVSLSPAEPPPMPRTGSRGTPIPPGSNVAEPGGVLGLGEDSAAAARRSMTRAGQLREQRAREIDRLAMQAVKAAEARSRDLLQQAAGKTGTKGAEAKLPLPKPGETTTLGGVAVAGDEGAAAFRAGKAAEAQAVPGLRKLPVMPKAKVSSRAELDLRRTSLLAKIKKLETGDSGLDKKLVRFNYLANLEKPTPAQFIEMGKLEKGILGSAKLPGTIKKRWEGFNKAAAGRASVDAVEEIRTAPARASDPNNIGVTARSEALAAKIQPPESVPPPVAPPPEVAVQAQKEIVAQIGRAKAAGTGKRSAIIAESEKGAAALEDLEKMLGREIQPPAGARGTIPAEPSGAGSFGPPPRGVEPDAWARINIVEDEARRLVERGVRDPRLIDEMRRFWGSKGAADRLGIPKAEIEKISGPPHKQRPTVQVMEELDARYRYLLDDPRGFFRTEALVVGSGAMAGGLLGATIEGEDAVDRFSYALSGAIIGGTAGWAGVKGVQAAVRAAKGPRSVAGEAVEVLDTANLLAGPAMIKASFGSMGGTAAGIWQRLREGRTADARRGLQFLKKEAPTMWWKTLTGPAERLGPVSKFGADVAEMAGIKSLPQKILINVLRPFIAADRTGGEVLKRMGFSKAEAERMMLMGEPTSWQGQTMLRLINSNMTFRMLAKFPRVRIGALERGIEFMPGASSRISTRHAKSPLGRFAPQEGLSKAALKARAEFGGAALVGGTVYGYWRDPSLAEASVASSAAGPAALPAAAGIAAGKGLRRGGTGLLEALASAASSVPQIGEADIRMLPQRVVPLRSLRRALEAAGMMEAE